MRHLLSTQECRNSDMRIILYMLMINELMELEDRLRDPELLQAP